MGNATAYIGGQPRGNNTIIGSRAMDNTQLVQWINTLIRYHNIKAFYNSALWEHVRIQVLDEQHCECQMCKSKGLYSPAEAVHHIKFLKRRPELALTKSNLMCLCKECHYAIHHKAESKPQLNKERW